MKILEVPNKDSISILTISEKNSWNMSDVKVGQNINGIMDYEVVEKTKKYTILRIRNLTRTLSKRTY